MVEFGAKLSLKDNMYATLQKNLKAQQEFSKQIKATANAIKHLAKQKLAPVLKVTDKATKVINKIKTGLKTVGKTVAKPFVFLKDGASKLISRVKAKLTEIKQKHEAKVALKDQASAGLGNITNLVKKLATGVLITATVKTVMQGIGASIGEGAKLQQSKGGIETLYRGKEGDGGVVDTVIDNANKAYKTAGLSANAYMETVTSFSASLLSSLGGDTAKSAEIADMAIIDMADNANKFGTDMSSIQTAYQGFAKQNYTMLDNLKLGYGGTKEEMERLLKDAQKYSGVKYDITNLSDVYSAIHEVQKKLGVAGATAEEAKKTFTGSFSAMKASAQNLLGNLAVGGDVTGSMEQLVDSAMIFLVNNFVPMVTNIFTALPSALSTGIKKVAPQLKTVGKDLIVSLKDGIVGLLPSSMQGVANGLFGSLGKALTSVTGVLSSVAPKIAEKLGGVFGDGGGIFDGIASAIEMAMPTVETLLLGVADIIASFAPVLSGLGEMFTAVFPTILGVIDSVIPVLTTYFEGWFGVLATLMPTVTQIIQTLGNIIQQVMPIIQSLISTAFTAIMPIVQALGNVIQAVLPVVQSIITAVAGAIQSVLPTVSRIFTEVGQKVAEIIRGVVVPVIQTFQGIFEKLMPVVQPIMEAIMALISGAWDVISPVLDLFMSTFEFLWGVIDPILNGIADLFVFVWDIIEPIIGWLADGLSLIGDAVSDIGNFIGDGLDSIGSFFGFAYGKDRVPYDNYPAILHQGEKVLTRNQADQYERQMSTRGIQVPKLLEVPQAKESKSYLEVSQNNQKSQKPVSEGANITIEKLADTVVIEKEADVDKVVEGMITKFRKLMPNMA